MQELVQEGADPNEMTPEMQELFIKKLWNKVKKVPKAIGKGLSIFQKVSKTAMPFLPDNYRKMAEKGMITAEQAQKYNDHFKKLTGN
jgi:hypothetical protein